MQSLLICLVGFQAPEIVIPSTAIFTTEISGLARTGAIREVVGNVLRVSIKRDSAETNATQLSLPNARAVKKGDVLLARFEVRGKTAAGTTGRVEFYFEKATSPWTKSVVQAVSTRPKEWKHIEVPFKSIANYAPAEVMASLRFAFGPQTVELRNFSISNFHDSKDLDALQREVRDRNRIGEVSINVNASHTMQRMIGLGGNFTKPRYGETKAMDAVGEAALTGLPVRIARTGLPLNHFAPSRNKIVDDQGPALASFQALQRLARLKVPIVSSVWEGADWLLPGEREKGGKILPSANYSICADLIVRYLTTARDRFGVTVDYFSFNEPDLGINFKFSGAEMAKFIGVLGPKLRAAKLPTKFIVGDTASGRPSARYSTEILSDKSIAGYLGPIGFHCWDALSASYADYRSIAAVGNRFGKEIWCLEAGHDAQLWQANNPWPTWQNAIRTAQAYLRTVNLTGCSTLAYWTYQNDYPIVSADGKTKYPVFHVLSEMSKVLDRGTTVIESMCQAEELQVVATKIGRNISLMGVNTIGGGVASISGFPPTTKLTVLMRTESGVITQTLRSNSDGKVRVTLPSSSFFVIRA